LNILVPELNIPEWGENIEWISIRCRTPSM